MPRLILVTRPQPQADHYKKLLEAEGYEVLAEPVLRQKNLDFNPPSPEGLQGLIFTSAAGVETYSQKTAFPDVPVYTVGPQTREAALEAGAKNVICAEGDANDLIALIRQNADPKKGALVHVRGIHAAADLEAEMGKYGFEVENLVIYEMEEVAAFSSVLVQKIRDGEIAAVTFFSKRTAESFCSLAQRQGLTEYLLHIKALCISDAVLSYVQTLPWRGVYAALTPDRAGMNALIKVQLDGSNSPEKRSFKMSKPNPEVIENAEEVIERFGGIRPMAKKIDVAVTTIQGWKKRGVIPANRREIIIEAARIHGVDLPESMQENLELGRANENEKPQKFEGYSSAASSPYDMTDEPEYGEEDSDEDDDEEEHEHESFAASSMLAAERREEQKERVSFVPRSPAAPEAPKKRGPRDEEEILLGDSIALQIKKAEGRAVTKSTLITITLMVLALAAAYFILDPFSPPETPPEIAALENKVETMEQDLAAVKEQQRSFRDMIPGNFRDQFGALQQQSENAQIALGDAIARAETLSRDVMGAENMQERLSYVESALAELRSSPQFASLMERMQSMQQSVAGQQQLDQSVNELSTLVMNAEGEGSQFDEALGTAREKSTALSQTFEGVPQEDLKAAVILLGFSQLREALNRGNQPFEDDLVLLMNVVGEDDAALRGSLERLAPHANRGVLSPAGLSSEFRTLAGDAVVASLKGEDVSVQEKAKARLNQIFSVEKDGELLTGTETQAQINETQNLLEAGELEAAIAQVAKIDGPAAQVLAPWIEKARATLTAQQTESVINQVLSTNFKDAARSAMDGLPGGELYINPETGVKIYKPAGRNFKQLQLDTDR